MAARICHLLQHSEQWQRFSIYTPALTSPAACHRHPWAAFLLSYNSQEHHLPNGGLIVTLGTEASELHAQNHRSMLATPCDMHV